MKKYLLLLILLSVAVFMLLHRPSSEVEGKGEKVNMKASSTSRTLVRVSPEVHYGEISKVLDGYQEDFNKTKKAVNQLQILNLSRLEILEIGSWISFKERESSDLALLAIKNDLLELLVESDDFPMDVLQLIRDVILDDRNSEVLREYAVQFSSRFIERNLTLSEAQGLIDDLYVLMEEERNTIAGTAILQMSYISRFKQIDKSRLLQVCNAVISDYSYSTSSRMSALNTLMEMGSLGLSKLIAIVESVKEPISLKMMSISWMSRLGGGKYIDTLIKLSQDLSIDKRLRKTAKLNLVKLK